MYFNFLKASLRRQQSHACSISNVRWAAAITASSSVDSMLV